MVYKLKKGVLLLPDLGARIEAERDRQGLSRKATAASAGLAECHWAQLERGAAQRMSLVTADRVAIALDKPLEWFRLPAGPQKRGKK